MKEAIVLMFCVVVLTSTPCFAGTCDDSFAVNAVADTTVVRPLGIAAIAVGTAAFIVSLPFALITGSTRTTAHEFISKPVSYTFARPLGDFQPNYTYTGEPCSLYGDERP